MVPVVGPENQNREEMLQSERADEILGWLAKYQYVSRDHVFIVLLWGNWRPHRGANSLDVEDVDLDDRFLQLEHRPDEGTTLKNGSSGEQLVSITPELSQLLEAYLDDIRPDTTDEYGREPLLESQQGRLSRATMRRIALHPHGSVLPRRGVS